MPPTVADLLGLHTRGDVKRWGAWLDGEGLSLRPALVAAARARGAEVPEDWAEAPGKRLLRACLDRAGASQVRTNPIARDEAFDCVHCARPVPLGGRRPRDHCPWCLHGLHVDDTTPGDRAARCGGLLLPIALEQAPKGLMIVFRCVICGISRRNRVLDDLDPPDDPLVVRKLVEHPGTPG